MKFSTAAFDKLTAQAAQARAKSQAAADESADLARRAERLETLEDQCAGQARKDAARYSELAARFAAEAERLEREARIAGATLARDQAREELKEAEGAVGPLRDAITQAAEALGAVDAALRPVRELPNVRTLARGLSFPQTDADQGATIMGLQGALVGESSSPTGRSYFTGLVIGLSNLGDQLPKLTAPAEAALARAEAELAATKA